MSFRARKSREEYACHLAPKALIPSEEDVTNARGFTLMETVVTAGIVAVVLSATIGVLARYTDSDVRTQKFLRAQHLAQAEVDEVLARHAIENSLASDTKGRSRMYAMEDLRYPVSQYYFHNFPIAFPKGNYPFNHGSSGIIDKDDPSAIETLFNDAVRGRTALGAPTDVPQPFYTVRYQLLGIEAGLSSKHLNLLINLTSQPTAGFYKEFFWDPQNMLTNSNFPKGNKVYNPLIADSSPSVALGAGWSRNVRRFTASYDGYRHFVSKVLIVRVYDRQHPNREIGQAYGVLTGRVQL